MRSGRVKSYNKAHVANNCVLTRQPKGKKKKSVRLYDWNRFSSLACVHVRLSIGRRLNKHVVSTLDWRCRVPCSFIVVIVVVVVQEEANISAAKRWERLLGSSSAFIYYNILAVVCQSVSCLPFIRISPAGSGRFSWRKLGCSCFACLPITDIG